jgi:hypothetical protein
VRAVFDVNTFVRELKGNCCLLCVHSLDNVD